ncbi:heparan-alpha-glucosaminide N-acetyltransferase domain-containing protein [Luteimonas sp BLCC-B24]|uniref:acyltransferase family protein n=1 Tax=Luteimonas sp. BLCC-B24 TaxID=3025317 RepID=UPI00234E0A82|nr:acyltransferase family protein [Luteimonas sp. BLCC-B24]MDC7807824.1 heparan-alpha-glucosaminide N-acetyltransferase domain-containing protein [Luteimonas sp. BLCC-B24]
MTSADSHAPPASAPVPPDLSRPVGRIGAIDLARGFAVCLMILSHGTNGLMPYDEFPDWGQVPVHAITKFSSSLFVIVFGIALAVAFVPKTGAPDWPQRRNRLLWRGVVVLFWYKVLTVVEMYGRHDRDAIVDTLLYRNFPSFVEILGFYAIALLWIPWLLPLWAKTPAWLRWLSPVPVAFASWWLLHHFDFWGVPQLQALLVEHPDYYTWGQLARGPLILVGLLIGGLLLRWYGDPRTRLALAGALALAAALLFAWFLLRADALQPLLVDIGRNAGKHPPQLMFMLFSVGGALALLALAVAGGEFLARALRPIAVIGSDALMAFIVHISVIFVLFRETLGYYQTVSYERALVLTVLLIAATAAWIWLWQAMKRAMAPAVQRQSRG